MNLNMDGLPLPVQKEIQYLFAAEFSLNEIGPEIFIVNAFIAMFAFWAVRKIGPYAIDRYYIEPYSNVSRSAAMANVLYRIFAPVVVCEAIHLGLACLLYLSCHRLCAVDWRWLSVAFYWVFMFVAKLVKRLFLSPKGFAFEAVASICLCIIFDVAVISRIPQEGFSVFDETNVGFQILIAIGFMVVYWITSLIIGSSEFGEDASVALTERLEKRLYGYLRNYKQIIHDCGYEKLFESDYLFKSIVLAVMYIEDTNRPRTIRKIENVLSYLGIYKTTGIMQCKATGDKDASKPYYTDEQSVRASLPRLEEYWRDFIRSVSMSGTDDSSAGSIWFTQNWYSINAEELERIIRRRFSLIYGRYRGSKALNCNKLFAEVLDFVKRENNQMIPSRITVASELFKDLAAANPDSVLTIASGKLNFYGYHELEPGQGVLWSLGWHSKLSTDMSNIVDYLRKANSISIDSIQVVDGVFCNITYNGRLFNGLDLDPNEWYAYEKPKSK